MNRLTDEMVRDALLETGMVLTPRVTCKGNEACPIGVVSLARHGWEATSNYAINEGDRLGLDPNWRFGVIDGFDGNDAWRWISGDPQSQERKDYEEGYAFGQRWRARLGLPPLRDRRAECGLLPE